MNNEIPKPTPLSAMGQMAVMTILNGLGLTGEDAVKIIDAFSSRGILIGFLAQDEPTHQIYSCRCLHPAVSGDRKQIVTVRINKR